jgi:hypothetical protein
MMTDDEIADLAENIKANGLIHPIVVDKAGVLIDGRNRAKACELIGIEPATKLFEGDDPRAFILANNVARRHMTAGQRAMAVAMVYPEAEHGGKRPRGSSSETKLDGFSKARLSQARTVLAHASDLAPGVLAGTEFLDAAYAIAVKRKQAVMAIEAQVERLREGAPDLADLVAEQRMPLDEAMTALHERQLKTRQIIDAGKRAAADGMTDFIGAVAMIAAAMQLGERGLLDAERLRKIADAHDALQSLFAKDGA